MVARAGQRRGTPSANSVVSVADLLARDAPWSGAPSAVAVAKRPADTAPAGKARNGSPAGSARNGSPAGPARGGSRAGSARNGGSVHNGSASGRRPASRPAGRTSSARARDTRLRQFVAVAWGPQWRFVTIAAAVLFTGLMANGVMLVAFHGPTHSATAQSDEGGYPATEDPNQASRSYDDNGVPIDSALTPMFAAPGAGNLAAANTSGVGLPLTLTSLGTSVPVGTPTTATRVLRSAPAVSAPVRAVSPTRSTTSTATTSPVTTGSRSSSSGGVGGVAGDVVHDTTSGLGKTVDKTTSGLGKTLKKTTTGLGDTVGNVADDLLGGGSSKSKSSSGSRSSSSSNSSKSGSNGGLLGGLLGK